MDLPARIARAQSLAQRQIKSRQLLEQPEPTRFEELADQISVANEHFREAPLTPRKIWTHVCCWFALLLFLGSLDGNVLGGLIVLPVVLLLLWVFISLPGWIGGGFSESRGRGSGGKYV